MTHNEQISLLIAARKETSGALTADQLTILEALLLSKPIISMNFIELRALQLVVEGMSISALVQASANRVADQSS